MGKISEAEIYSQFSAPGGILKEAERSAAVAVDPPGQKAPDRVNAAEGQTNLTQKKNSDLSCLT
jgi:hypothetical protein